MFNYRVVRMQQAVSAALAKVKGKMPETTFKFLEVNFKTDHVYYVAEMFTDSEIFLGVTRRVETSTRRTELTEAERSMLVRECAVAVIACREAHKTVVPKSHPTDIPWTGNDESDQRDW